MDICTILSEKHQEGEQIIFRDIRVLLNANNRNILPENYQETDGFGDANNRSETDFMMSLYIGENPPNCPSIVHFYLNKLEICTILSENHQEGEQIIFMDIGEFLSANDRTETDFTDEPLFRKISAQLAVYCRFLLKEIGILQHFIGKSPGREQIIFMDIRVLLNANNRR